MTSLHIRKKTLEHITNTTRLVLNEWSGEVSVDFHTSCLAIGIVQGCWFLPSSSKAFTFFFNLVIKLAQNFFIVRSFYTILEYDRVSE